MERVGGGDDLAAPERARALFGQAREAIGATASGSSSASA